MIFSIDRNVAITIVEKGEMEMKYNIERKEKLIRIWITMIRHGSLGREVQESWPYLSNVSPSP